MSINYLCPHCRGAINAGNNIILSAKSPKHKFGLVLLHEEVGNYSVITSSTLFVDKGEVVDFFCPICHASLNTLKAEHLAKYIRVEENGKESHIIISRKYGDKQTFHIDENKQITSYGESMKKYMDPEWYL